MPLRPGEGRGPEPGARSPERSSGWSPRSAAVPLRTDRPRRTLDTGARCCFPAVQEGGDARAPPGKGPALFIGTHRDLAPCVSLLGGSKLVSAMTQLFSGSFEGIIQPERGHGNPQACGQIVRSVGPHWWLASWREWSPDPVAGVRVQAGVIIGTEKRGEVLL